MTRAAAWAGVVVVVLAYPLVNLAGGAPRLPTRDDCVRTATRDGKIDAVFGYFETELEAAAVRDRALEVGFQGTELLWNGCGRVRVYVSGIPTLEVGREFVDQARTVDFDVTLEQSG
jgi:hypothetical protein